MSTAKSIDDLSPAEKRALLARLLGEKAGGGRAAAEPPAAQLPAIVPDAARRHEPFPLTDMQQAYWIGRGQAFEGGNVGCHVYLEIESAELDLARFNRAWQALVGRHDMLRAVVLPDGRQQILERVPAYECEVLDLRGREAEETAARLGEVRERLSHQVLKLEEWPLFELRATLLDGGRTRLHFSLDCLICDTWSILTLFRELGRLYRHPELELPPLEISFRDYVLAERGLRQTRLYEESLEYWQKRLPALPPAPDFPLVKSPSSVTSPRFVRRESRLGRETWGRLKSRAHDSGLTPPGVLLAAFGNVLGTWSRSPRLTINVPRFNRLPLHPQVNDLVGSLASFTLLEMSPAAGDTFEARARRLQEQLWQDLGYQYVSGVQVLRELARLSGEKTRAAMPVVFTSIPKLNSSDRDASVFDMLGDLVHLITQTPQVWIDQQVTEKDGELVFVWDAVDELFPEGYLDEMFGAYCRHLGELGDDPASWGRVPRLTPSRQLRQREEINATEAPVPDELLHTLFAAQAAANSERPAVITSGRTLTYGELDRRSTQVGRWLRERGARPDGLVAVVLEKGWEQIVALLGVLKSGAAYLPVDPGFPSERVRLLLEHGEVRLALTRSAFDERFEWPAGVERLCLDSGAWAEMDDAPLAPAQRPDDLAAVIYTSGSTGTPKGVMITHRGVVNAVLDPNRVFGVGPDDRTFGLTSFDHDMSFYDLFGPLAAGGAVVVPDASSRRDPAHWAELMSRERVTIWNSVPAFLEMLVEYLERSGGRAETPLGNLRLAFLGGDWIPVGLPGRLRALAGQVRVASVGGPTETSLWNIRYPVDRVDPAWRSIPYGRPISNSRYYVFNEFLEDCPTWVPGVMYCGGAGVARGYWRDEEKTRDRFVEHPRTGERLYRTGDVGRYLPGGDIEFLGREDYQLKILGQRIEPGEIEATLLQHPGVSAAVVRAVGEARGKKRLVAYVVADLAPDAAANELRGFVAGNVPDYMVPSAFVLLDAMPLSPNGKVDRGALPEPPRPTAEAATGEEEPAADGGLRAQIARLVARVLEVDSVDPDANLLDMGANSVEMVRIANLLETELGFRPVIEELFRDPTVGGLAAQYERRLDRPGPGEVAPVPPPGAAAGYDGRAPFAPERMLSETDEREAFKKSQPGLRRFENGSHLLALAATEPAEEMVLRPAARASRRTYRPEPVGFVDFGNFLACLRQTTVNGGPKYLYPSGGGLYPVQTYLHVKEGRVAGVGAGTYYYHPAEHGLVALAPGAAIDRHVHFPTNLRMFDEAAFSVFLIAQLSAVTPMYGEQSVAFATLEAGYMGQLMTLRAPACRIGLCPVGGLDFRRVRHLFSLDETHLLVHSLLGGRAEAQDAAAWEPFEEGYSGVGGGAGGRVEGEI